MDMLLGLDMLKRHQVIKGFAFVLGSSFRVLRGYQHIVCLGCVSWKTEKPWLLQPGKVLSGGCHHAWFEIMYQWK